MGMAKRDPGKTALAMEHLIMLYAKDKDIRVNSVMLRLNLGFVCTSVVSELKHKGYLVDPEKLIVGKISTVSYRINIDKFNGIQASGKMTCDGFKIIYPDLFIDPCYSGVRRVYEQHV